jgi:hypothetical protein
MADQSEQNRLALDALAAIRAGQASAPWSNWVDSLASLAPPPPPVIQNRWFKDETIRIDGYIFERCRFDRCNLVTEAATFSFRSCFISGDCGLYFVGAALKVARLVMHALTVKQRITKIAGEEALHATINPDGTFSLE